MEEQNLVRRADCWMTTVDRGSFIGEQIYIYQFWLLCQEHK